MNCIDALLACPLAPGATADPNLESVETITTQPDGTVTKTVACDVPLQGAAPPQVTTDDIRQWVIRQLPVGSIGTPDATSLVNVKTVVWFNVPPTREWGPVTVVQAGVRIRATLVRVHWDFGDGTSDDATDAGRTYDPAAPCDAKCAAYYGHEYTRSWTSIKVTAQSYWKAEFSVDGGPFTALPAPVAANASAPIAVTVVQAHSELVAGS